MTGFSDDFFRTESLRLVAFLTSRYGLHRLQFAEDVTQETLVRALQTWPYRGIPDRPGAWLTQTAKNLATDLLRREKRWRDKESGIASEHDRWLSKPIANGAEDETFTDDTLRMLFVCFHPQLSNEAQTALALRTLCGLSPFEIAAAFLTSEAAISKRLVRARQRIRELALPFAVPDNVELPARLEGVLGTLYLLFSEGYKASSGDSLVRVDLCQEAIRLATLLAEHPVTCKPRTWALLALMLLNAARLNSRTDETGHLLRLREQDRSSWDADMIQRGIRCLAQSGQGNDVSVYHLKAGIAACHCLSSDEATTDWARILMFYDQLLSLADSPVVRLNRAVALARIDGPQVALEAIANLPLDSYYLLHAVTGTFEAELGNWPKALGHFRRAEQLAPSASEKEFLLCRINECETHGIGC